MGRSWAVLLGEQTPPISPQMLAFQRHFVCEATACLGGQPGGRDAGVPSAWGRAWVALWEQDGGDPSCLLCFRHTCKRLDGPKTHPKPVPILAELAFLVRLMAYLCACHVPVHWNPWPAVLGHLHQHCQQPLQQCHANPWAHGPWQRWLGVSTGLRQLFLSPSPPWRGGKGPRCRPFPVPLTPVWLPGHPGVPIPGTSPAPGTVPRGHSGPGALLQTSLPPRARYPRRPPPLPRAPALLTAGKVGAVSLRRPSADLPVTLEKPSERLSHCAAPGFPGN